ncbi:MAG: (Fe-S)-binding protein [Candidatus Izemoplasmatales bacterium]
MGILIPPLVLGGLGMILGLMIYFVAQKFGVEEDHRIQDVEHLLPNYNCGACGYPGCKGMAEAIIAGKAVPAQCKPIKKEEIEILNQYLEALKTGTPVPAGTK